MFEIMIVIDAAAAELGLETNFGIQDMIWCKERERDLMKKWLKIMQPQVTGHTDANPIPNIEILLQ